MTLLPIVALILSPNPPLPLSEAHMNDIGCVAVIGIAAHEQRRGQSASSDFPAVSEDGKRWAGIVGDRIMAQTGQPREVVALAINEAVKAEQAKSATAKEASGFRERLASCVGIMNANLGAMDAGEGAAEADDAQ